MIHMHGLKLKGLREASLDTNIIPYGKCHYVVNYDIDDDSVWTDLVCDGMPEIRRRKGGTVVEVCRTNESVGMQYIANHIKVKVDEQNHLARQARQARQASRGGTQEFSLASYVFHT